MITSNASVRSPLSGVRRSFAVLVALFVGLASLLVPHPYHNKHGVWHGANLLE